MRICRNCGHIDNEGWQPSRFRAEVEILHIDTFEENYPKVEFNQENLAWDQYHAYLFRESSQMVERVPLILFKSGGKSAWATPREKYYKSRLNPNQTRLLDAAGVRTPQRETKQP